MMIKKEILKKLDDIKKKEFYSSSIDELSKKYWEGYRTCAITVLELNLKDNKLPWE